MIGEGMNGSAASPLSEESASASYVPAVLIDSTKEGIGGKVAVNMSPFGPTGRVKAPPICMNESLKMEAMSTEELSMMCFPPGATMTPLAIVKEVVRTVSAPCSSASSDSSKDSDTRHHDRHSSELLNAKVLTRETSRQGRESQRWLNDPNTHQVIRLVTGSVPILNDGRILFVSASRKPEWILPKGGWELDETVEESAIRETYEEAGVLGTLGPILSEIQYETRKSRKRRLELEEMLRKKKERHESDFSSGTSDMMQCFEDELQPSEKPTPPGDTSTHSISVIPDGPEPTSESKEATSDDVAFTLPEPANVPQPTMSEDAVARIRAARSAMEKSMMSDETSSVASDASANYSLVRMILFPLYVSEVMEAWPESGRFRRAMLIDDAIEMMKSRPEFHAALVEVKEKGLHLVANANA